jgi:threonyl-tRNA synthetase
MLVVGDKEIESQSVAVRSRDDGDLGTLSLEKIKNKIRSEL